MTIRELIKILETIQDNHPEQELDIKFSVRDQFSRFGNDATVNDVDLNSGIWSGIATNKDTGITRIDVHLENDFDDKRAKVTFRK